MSPQWIFASTKAVSDPALSPYQYEAAIAAKHLKSKSFDGTDWGQILHRYRQLHVISPSPFNQLKHAIMLFLLHRLEEAKREMDALDPSSLEQRAYLYSK